MEKLCSDLPWFDSKTEKKKDVDSFPGREAAWSLKAVSWQVSTTGHSCWQWGGQQPENTGLAVTKPCLGSGSPSLPGSTFPSHPHPSNPAGAFCFWFSFSANSVTICQVPKVVFAWWKCWPYCESILTASQSKVVRQWGKFTMQADKAASIMCENTNNRRINAKQWEHPSTRQLQAQQCASVWVECQRCTNKAVVGTSR